jgi:anti-sigma B factor antagonist
MTPPSFEVNFEKKGTTLIVNPIGRLDASTAEKFGEVVTDCIKQVEKAIILNFSQTTYISSIGLRTVISAAQILHAKGVHIALICSYEPVLHLFKMSGFKMLFPIYASMEEAEAAENKKDVL